MTISNMVTPGRRNIHALEGQDTWLRDDLWFLPAGP
jgi:hypothetical protein